MTLIGFILIPLHRLSTTHITSCLEVVSHHIHVHCNLHGMLLYLHQHLLPVRPVPHLDDHSDLKHTMELHWSGSKRRNKTNQMYTFHITTLMYMYMNNQTYAGENRVGERRKRWKKKREWWLWSQHGMCEYHLNHKYHQTNHCCCIRCCKWIQRF